LLQVISFTFLHPAEYSIFPLTAHPGKTLVSMASVYGEYHSPISPTVVASWVTAHNGDSFGLQSHINTTAN